MNALLAIPMLVALSADRGAGGGAACAEPLASMAALAAPLELAREAPRLAAETAAALPARPSEALRDAALALAAEATSGDSATLARKAGAFRSLLVGHCAAAARPRQQLPSAADRQALREIYERPELRRARLDTAGFRRLLSGLWARLLELLGDTEAERYASVGRMVFILAGLAAGLAGLTALRARRERSRTAAGVAAETVGRLPPPDRSAALAEAALAQGDLTGAVRHAFLSALATLEERGWLPRERSLTNRELAERLAGHGAPLVEEFAGLGRLFDGVMYGGARIAATEARAGLAAAARIRERAGAPR